MPLSERNKMENDKFTLIKLETEKDFSCEEVKNFDCGRVDLTEFFIDDAYNHHKELLTTTYCCQPKEATEKDFFFPVAFISFLNDNIKVTKEERKKDKRFLYNWIKKSTPFPKRLYETFPAVKIGRLGVHKDYQRSHVGSSLLNLTKDFFLTNNRTGCRFLTVDAYNDQVTLNFYNKNGFEFLWDEDHADKTRIMFYDLLRHRV